MQNKYKMMLLISIFVVIIITGCTSTKQNDNHEQGEINASAYENTYNKTGSLLLDYATQFRVDYYENDYTVVYVGDGSTYIIVPENQEDNSLGIDNPVFIHRPCDSIYLAASSAMDLFLTLDELECISACSTKPEDYSMDKVKNAVENGMISYVGKYSAPDYERLLSLECNLAIESTMISHSPKVKEQLQRLNIPVLVERSSYEEHPLGRLEWIKLYGVLVGKEKEANDFYNNELEKIEKLSFENNDRETDISNSDDKIINKSEDSTEDSTESSTEESSEDGTEDNKSSRKRIAYFSITSNGYITVRKPGDYICKIIEMAGGEYALNGILSEEENALSTMNIGMEEFYKEACDADILIYNGTIDGGVKSIEELLDKNKLLGEFKAIKEGKVWSTGLNMFQESSKTVDVILEMSELINDSDYQGEYLKLLL